MCIRDSPKTPEWNVGAIMQCMLLVITNIIAIVSIHKLNSRSSMRTSKRLENQLMPIMQSRYAVDYKAPLRNNSRTAVAPARINYILNARSSNCYAKSQTNSLYLPSASNAKTFYDKQGSTHSKLPPNRTFVSQLTDKLKRAPAAKPERNASSIRSSVLSQAHRGEQSGNKGSASGEVSEVQRGKVGLRNLGNTCYMNAALQNVIHTPLLVAEVINGNNTVAVKRESCSEELFRLIKAFTENKLGNAAAKPSELKLYVGMKYPQFSGYTQEDSIEFLHELLELLNAEFNRVTKKIPYRMLEQTSESVSRQVFAFGVV
eukprot:TRINITY_DN6447_c0_g2_i1.p1 TRINITY_DN6447_c0_g2~~TRINITY_DN6447_c0_g2_i1.p1  ORF type:complete len:317 (-),score=45.66 TRINITY_DN6447_c0_g2_i1:80-1030(-)